MAKLSPEDALEQCGDFLTNLGEQMHQISMSLRDGDDEGVKDLVESLPNKREITKNLVLLGKVLEGQPWTKAVKRNAG